MSTGRNVWSEYLSLRSFFWVLAPGGSSVLHLSHHLERHSCLGHSGCPGAGHSPALAGCPMTGVCVWREAAGTALGTTAAGPVCGGSTRLERHLWTHSWPPKAAAAKARSSFPSSALEGRCRSLCFGGTSLQEEAKTEFNGIYSQARCYTLIYWPFISSNW